MTQSQRDFFLVVIQPKLVKMAIDGSLPTDMNELCYSHFEDEANIYNRVGEPITKKMIDTAMECLCMTVEDAERVLTSVASDGMVLDSDMLDSCHPDIQVSEQFEFTFTVKDFFQYIR